MGHVVVASLAQGFPQNDLLAVHFLLLEGLQVLGQTEERVPHLQLLVETVEDVVVLLFDLVQELVVQVLVPLLHRPVLFVLRLQLHVPVEGVRKDFILADSLEQKLNKGRVVEVLVPVGLN